MQLEQPFRILGIFSTLLKDREDEDSMTGSKGVDDYLALLSLSDLEKLLLYIRDWNTNSKHANTAQSVLMVLLKSIPSHVFTQLPKAKQILESLIAYTDRHLIHTNQLLKDHYLVDYTLERMDAIL